MAEKSECLTEMLSERCEELESFFADLHIDQVLEKNPAERVKSISQWARSCLSSYRLQITAKIAPIRPETAVVIMQDRNFDNKKTHYDLKRGLQLIKEGNGEVIVPIFFRFPERDSLGNSPGVAMEMRKLRYKFDSQEGFASFVARKSPKQEGTATRDLRNTERIELSSLLCRVRYSLDAVERSFKNMHMRALQRVRLEEYGIVYTLRLARQTVAGTGSQCDQMACSHNSLSGETLLQRLGYAPAEIALGKEVGRTHDERDAAVREIEEKPWDGHLYATAVQYCLSFETKDTKDLEDFYDAVVCRYVRECGS